MAALALAAMVFTPGIARAASAHATKSVVVSTAKSAKFGTILVSGKTLYSLKPGGTSCGSKCLRIWPELLLPKGVSKATAGGGVSASKLGTIRRAGGALQVTYAGKALYWFSQDTASGQVNGNISDLWGKWSVVVTKKAATGGVATTTTTSNGGGTTTTTKPSSGGTTTTTMNPGGGVTTTTAPSTGGAGF
jgi:predicted lipoprotein with Yx(FWY)xxD motif